MPLQMAKLTAKPSCYPRDIPHGCDSVSGAVLATAFVADFAAQDAEDTAGVE
jgi:hypothetical protein